MLNILLPWIIAVVILVILPIALVLFADDHPRSDDPPDTGDKEDGLPAFAPGRVSATILPCPR